MRVNGPFQIRKQAISIDIYTIDQIHRYGFFMKYRIRFYAPPGYTGKKKPRQSQGEISSAVKGGVNAASQSRLYRSLIVFVHFADNIFFLGKRFCCELGIFLMIHVISLDAVSGDGFQKYGILNGCSNRCIQFFHDLGR